MKTKIKIEQLQDYAELLEEWDDHYCQVWSELLQLDKNVKKD